MRRKDREVESISEISDIVSRCTVMTVAVNDNGIPYQIPLNFGAEIEEGAARIYFHCANEGYKLDLIKQDNRVGFEMHTSEKYIQGSSACAGTMQYESVCGSGTAEVLDGEAKHRALVVIMHQHTGRSDWHFNSNELDSVTVVGINVDRITAKRNI